MNLSALLLRKIVFQGVLNRFLFVFCFLIAGIAHADVWKYQDEAGVTHFTNTPPKGLGALVIQSEPAVGVTTGGLSGLVHESSAKNAASSINASAKYLAVQASLSQASASFGVDYELIKAVVSAESAFNPQAVSNKGAVGLMQIMPATAHRYGVRAEPGISVSKKLTDPDLNIKTGTRYLADLLRLFNGRTELAVAAYNAGEGAVMRAGNRIPDYKETQQYVVRVMSVYRVLQLR